MWVLSIAEYNVSRVDLFIIEVKVMDTKKDCERYANDVINYTKMEYLRDYEDEDYVDTNFIYKYSISELLNI
jgi:hypothetical protein